MQRDDTVTDDRDLTAIRNSSVSEAVTTVLGEGDGTPAPVPMRTPGTMWAWSVTTADLDPTDRPLLVEGHWVATPPPPASLCDGGVVVRLLPPGSGREDRVTVEMLLAHEDRWTRVGLWPDLDREWPRVIAPTADAIRCLHGEAAEMRYAQG